jgi:hypothetical protein
VSGSDPAILAWLASASATDNCGSVTSFTSDVPAFFPVGTTVVTWTARDPNGNQSQCSSSVVVADTTPPAITAQLTSCCLWPPNHEIVDVGTYQVVDACDPSAAGTAVVTVTSDEPPAQGAGGPKHCADAVVEGNHISLRSERSGDNGRVYGITITAKDASGNPGTLKVQGGCAGCSGAVCVPHDQSSPSAGEDRPPTRPSGVCNATDDGQTYNALACQ